jgi:ABC-type sugar transport system permease subunit
MASTLTGLTRAPAGGRGPVHTEGRPSRATWASLKLYLVLFGLMLPSIAGLLLITYYPQYGAIKFSTYNWDGQQTQEFIGFKNFKEALTADPLFWQSFKLVMILLAANLLKMWPSIIAAIVLHRLRSERWQYIYRVLFVVPMVIPGVVSLLVWKSFFEPGSGALNVFLNATGLMKTLAWFDQKMVWLVKTPFAVGVRDNFSIGGIHGLWVMVLLAIALIVLRMLSRPGSSAQRNASTRWMVWTAATLITVAIGLALVTCVWPTKSIRGFAAGTPGWLGNENLIIPSVIFWGFPWVGTVGVLIYLAGLQNITQDVYEAAELDGVGTFRKLFAIELPLIMTQVRINLIFLTIGTITDYGFFLLLLGPGGGPGNKGMVPGLYMYNSAFNEQRFGYACALGMILFVILLVITVLYQKYVRVDK